MKKKILGHSLSWLIRWLIVTAIIAGGAFVYVDLTYNQTTTVLAPYHWGSNHEFADTLYPKQSITHTCTIVNDCPDQDYDVDLIGGTVPDGKGLTVDYPNKVTVLAGGSVSFDVTTTASKSVEPAVYNTHIDFER